jgi:methyl-accepting chemotaxis protein
MYKVKEIAGSTIERVSTVRIKLIAAFTFLFLLTFIFISLSGYMTSKSMISKNIDTRAHEVMAGHAAEIDQWIKRTFSIVNAYSYLIGRAIPDDKNITSEILNNFGKESFSDLYYGSASGKFISGKNWKPPAGYDPRKRPWYISAVNGKNTQMGNIYIDLETNSLAVPVVSPIYSRNGSLRGVLSADILLYTLEDKLKNMKVNTMGQAMLIDRNGMALVYPDKSLHGRKLSGVPGINEVIGTILKNKQGRVEYITGAHNVII